jgi:hypothetical protein
MQHLTEHQMFAMFCGECGVTGPAGAIEDEAVEKWNLRFGEQ